MPRISIIGAAGYAGGGVLSILSTHPGIAISMLVSSTFAGQPIATVFPGSLDRTKCFVPLDIEKLSAGSDLVFIAQESGFAMRHVPALLEAGLKVIDLSADFRLRDASTYKKWYRIEHESHALLSDAVFGLPELYRETISEASLVANPGCYPTAAILAIAPLLRENLIDPDSIIIDAKSGVSGAGRGKGGSDYNFSEVNESAKAYAVGGIHRHTPEIEQALSSISSSPIVVSFTPHLIPMTRGILATCYATLNKEKSNAEILDMYREQYADEQFVTIYPEGNLPPTKAVFASNQCHIGVAIDARTRRVVVVSAIDNLVKGAAGQAVQNMNIMLGIPESTGLLTPGVWP